MFQLTPDQVKANALLAGSAMHAMLFGGSRSGKTFLIVRGLAVRALKAPMSRHAMLRHRLGHIKQSVVQDTFPKMMKLCFPKVEYELHVADMFVTFENESELWFGGLDDKERVEKILGNEYATVALNECSQISWGARNMALTRLAQQVTERVMVGGQLIERQLPLRMWYDENPPDKAHWSYRVFVQKVDPETKKPLPNPEQFCAMQMNPGGNSANLAAGYIDSLKGMSARMQKRFLLGEFKDANPGALFPSENLDKWRVVDGDLPDMQRIVIAVDPSGADDDDNVENDEIGIAVAGLGTDGNGYMLEDLTVKGGPALWGKVVSNAYDRWNADRVVAEVNYGGAMVKQVIQSARRAQGQPPVPFRAVTASRGKVVRAEPVSALVETGRIRMSGYFHALEDELAAMTTHGYTGENSPNRADAFVWAFAELFPALTVAEKPVTKPTPPRQPVAGGWMG
jgi:predicted phage terminase large subunit-like protein